MPAPAISVVVPSHNRALRLLWLLNSLELQDLPRDRWEVVVAHDSTDGRTEPMLEGHPLAQDGTLRHLGLEPMRGNSASRLRNAGWRAARGQLIAFTDDDCRAPDGWLRLALAAAERAPGAIVQGATRGDPDEVIEQHGAHVHRQDIDPPSPYAEACNIVYPREVLERVGGFAEEPPVAAGEDTDLALRAQAAGAQLVGAPEVLTYHAIEATSLAGRLRSLWRWGDLALLVRRHPEHRRAYILRTFWKPGHVWLGPALLGITLARRGPAWLLLAVPWYRTTPARRGPGARLLVRHVTELPGRLVVDLAEFLALARGSVKHRSPLL